MSPEATDWRPGADLATLRERARILGAVRRFLGARGVLEVETPLLCATTTPETDIPITRAVGEDGVGAGYLQTSPELAMKRLMAAGSGAIFQVTRAFRWAEAGRLHNPEFTILEWYRPGLGYLDLAAEVLELLDQLLGPAPCSRVRYRDAFRAHAGLDPWVAPAARLAALAREQGLVADPKGGASPDPETCADLLFDRLVMPALASGRVLVLDWPSARSPYARRCPAEPGEAERFELLVDGVEVANGYREITDPAEQRRTLEDARRRRGSAGREAPPADERFLAALEHGLPECSGVAVGLDRLVMLSRGLGSLDRAMAFTHLRA